MTASSNLSILVVGSGGREHAIVRMCIKSPLAKRVIAAPGNGGMSAQVDCHPVAADDVNGLVKLAREQQIDLVIVGPEVPLSLGLVDELQKVGILAYGPTAQGAQLEASKSFCKDFFTRHKRPPATKVSRKSHLH